MTNLPYLNEIEGYDSFTIVLFIVLPVYESIKYFLHDTLLYFLRSLNIFKNVQRVLEKFINKIL